MTMQHLSFVERILELMEQRPEASFLREVRGQKVALQTNEVSRRRLLAARGTLRSRGLVAGDRIALVAPNSIDWACADLACLAEGIVVVPLYHRQSAGALASVARDAEVSLVIGPPEFALAGTPHLTFERLFQGTPAEENPRPLADEDPVTIVYTSGTSSDPRGVVLRRANVDFMLERTSQALGSLMGDAGEAERVYHYLPFCFCGSRLVLWTALLRGSHLFISTDLERLREEIRVAQPHYFLNVPMLLERIKSGVDEAFRRRARPVRWLYDRVSALICGDTPTRAVDRAYLALARVVLFPKIRSAFGANLQALICGSAPLRSELQRWFAGLGLPVYQVYGLTETTGIVSMDIPPASRPGWVGKPLDGVDVRIDDSGELLVRGPNNFGHYWRQPDRTSQVFSGEWFRTGDLAEIDADGSLRIIGRARDVLVATSGHNITPEPIEEKLISTIPGAEQVVLFGHGRPFLTALVAGKVSEQHIESAISSLNSSVPHYQRVRRFVIADESFTPENGLLTANRKLRRRAIEQQYAKRLEEAYR